MLVVGSWRDCKRNGFYRWLDGWGLALRDYLIPGCLNRAFFWCLGFEVDW